MRMQNKLKVIPLGGLGEIGKNCTIVEYKNEMIMIDCGLTFPDEDMLGVDIVIPDFTYVEENKDKLKGIFITHGHEDHIGAIAYLLKTVDTNVYCSKLTKGLLENKFKEHGLNSNRLKMVNVNNTVKVGNLSAEFIRVSHSIPDSCAIAVKSPIGTILFTGDFKMDFTPIDGEPTDIQKLASLGRKGLLCLFSDSTNVEIEGSSMSEKEVGETFINLFGQAPGRIIVATFASNLHRVQQVIFAAEKYNKKVVLSGRSMINNVKIASSLGYLKIRNNTLIDMKNIKDYSDDQIVVLSTGTQGEPLSALTRMANNEHKQVHLNSSDTVILSSSAIPGNEMPINNTINNLTKIGCDIIYDSLAKVHASGHACQEEIKLMHQLTTPKYFIPAHGEPRQLKKHMEIAMDMGLNKENILVGQNGDVFEFTKKSARINGKVQAGNVLVDGSGIGDVGNIVLKDRKHLSEDGLLVVSLTIEKHTQRVLSNPEIVSRGFIYVKENQDLIENSKDIVMRTMKKCEKKDIHAISQIKYQIREALKSYIYNQTGRDPMILPVLTEVDSNEY
ncbi:MAG: ribonuclease J [Anaerococcus vaginalis]|uniref:Ribonuclease J n=1 Tax=Anaerococcus obesiensis TaxID=1287640 RepID=A0A7T7UTC3_9FIRM|nr:MULTISPECIES: ribonuclease J [Anaerococcus]MDU1764167.1 ribonuclease J [Anaerococcus vaginalis]MDU4378216.1 ribonuclease J [Anaerococcus vaginalis]MDU5823562.1 ribonuclease J [Anaerococcus vaginalis]MDU7649488.1 ribonuclease J [Anaerococcus vaginalis]QQN55819.1 ribonuclease J [Anaerococcus obesiensis]